MHAINPEALKWAFSNPCVAGLVKDGPLLRAVSGLDTDHPPAMLSAARAAAARDYDLADSLDRCLEPQLLQTSAARIQEFQSSEPAYIATWPESYRTWHIPVRRCIYHTASGRLETVRLRWWDRRITLSIALRASCVTIIQRRIGRLMSGSVVTPVAVAI